MLRSLPLQLISLCLTLVVGRVAVGQTVIINEVSNGPAGAQEYMELLVVPDGPVTPCTPQSCLDLRGWMIDDNNGFHGSGGVAQGAARFSAHALWSCVPVGTIIVIYNAEDVNPAIPSIDATLGDGDCSILIPSSDLSYFEYTNTTPAAAPCDYPSGWGNDPAPNWSNLALANTGDCVHIADAAGCMVFSLCYGNVSQNASVHFPGNGGDRVWYFTNGDPFSAGAWVQGCAGDIAVCGSDDQTPGTANDAANAAWMATFNNGCVPPQQQQPLIASTTSTAGCGCDGTATASASGSSTPYAFLWFASTWAPLGQSTEEITDLCGGTYHVIVTSASGCKDTATVVVSEDTPVHAGTDSPVALCSGDAPIDLFEALAGIPQTGGTWSPTLPGSNILDPATDAPGAYTYTVNGSGACPNDEAVVQVDIDSAPDLMVIVTDVSCFGLSDGSVHTSVDPPGNYAFEWSGGLSDASSHDGLPAGEWTVEVSGPEGCSASATAVITGPEDLVLTTTSTPEFCGSLDGSACVTIQGGAAPYGIQWDDADAQTDDCAADLAADMYSVTVTDANGCAVNAPVEVMQTGGDFTVTHAVQDVLCAGDATGSVALTIDPPGEYVVGWIGPDGYTAAGDAIVALEAGNYNYDVQDPSGCGVSSMALVGEPDPLTVSAFGTSTSCAGICDGIITPAVSGGTAPWQLTLDDEPLPTGPTDGRCAGSYIITAVDAAGCELVTEVIVEEGTGSVVPVITPAGPLCANDGALVLTATPVGGSWNGPGVLNAVTGVFDPAAANAGTHLVTYTLGSDCGGSASSVILINATPVARFISPLEQGGPVIDNSSHADHIRWWLNDADMGTGPQLVLPASEEGTSLSICLAASSDAGCSDTTCGIISTPSSLFVHVPDAFSPNGDGINDLFHMTISGPPLKTFTFDIYDRWGKAIFTTTDPSVAWEGNADGHEIPIGVYNWRVNLATAKEDRVMLGHVTLVR